MRVRGVVALLSFAACGRLHFDARSDATASDATGDVLATRCDTSATFTSITRLDNLCTNNGDGGIRLSHDELVAYFHTDRISASHSLFVSTRSSRSDPFPPATDTGLFGLFPSLSRDSLTMIYDDGTSSILATTRASTAVEFTAGTALPTIDTAAEEAQALLGGGERTLYFARRAPSMDLIAVDWPSLTGERAVMGVNTTMDERIPVLSADELTIYWAIQTSSNKIWMARRTSVTEPFSGAILVPELVSAVNESPAWLSEDQCRLYFESDRDGANYDLYVAERVPQ